MSALFSIAIVSLVAVSAEPVELPRWSPFKRQSIESSLFPDTASAANPAATFPSPLSIAGGDRRLGFRISPFIITGATGPNLVGGGTDSAVTGSADSDSGGPMVPPPHAAAYLSL